MKKENDEIIDLFRSRLGNAEMSVRDGFWDELNQGMINSCQHRRRIVFLRVAAAASVLLVLAASSAAFWFFSPKEEIGQAFTQLAVSGMGDLNGDRVNQSFEPVHAQPLSHKPASTKYGLLSQHAEEDDDSVTISMSFTFSMTTTSRHNGDNVNPGNDMWKAGTDVETVDSSDEKQYYATNEPVRVSVKKKSTWAVKAALGTALPAENGQYKMPVMAAVTLEKILNNYLSVEAGLQYSNLRSEGQGLHYLGIPVKMNVLLADTKKFDIYASVGGVADKCIAGAPNNDFKSEPIQLALAANVGLRYKINDKVAIFAEPGISHHFKTDSELETIRTKRPTNFNLLCGIRMTY